MNVTIKTPEEVGKMRIAGQMVAHVLTSLKIAAQPGVTTAHLNELAHAMIRNMGADPLFLGYPGLPGSPPFPGVICTSVNEAVVHGVPNDQPLKDGDIVGIDCGIGFDGFCGDSAVTFAIGDVAEATEELMKITQAALYDAIGQMKPGNTLGDVCAALQKHAESHDYGIVRQFVGHGIGREMHEGPHIPNYVTDSFPGTDMNMVLEAGHVFAIEPMFNNGAEEVQVLDDGWTVVTGDRELSAHFEHTIAITERGPKVLTRRPEEVALPF